MRAVRAWFRGLGFRGEMVGGTGSVFTGFFYWCGHGGGVFDDVRGEVGWGRVRGFVVEFSFDGGAAAWFDYCVDGLGDWGGGSTSVVAGSGMVWLGRWERG